MEQGKFDNPTVENPFAFLRHYNADQTPAEVFDAYVKASEELRDAREHWQADR